LYVLFTFSSNKNLKHQIAGGDLTHRDRDSLERFLSAHRLPLVPELTVHNYYDLCFEQPPGMARKICVIVLSAEPAPLIDALVSSRRFVERGVCRYGVAVSVRACFWNKSVMRVSDACVDCADLFLVVI
jgi:hypothetical protein